MTLETVYRLDEAIDDLNLPYLFDISIRTQIQNEDLIEHIRRVGKTLYARDATVADTT